MATLLQKGAITRVSTSEQQAGFYSIYFLVPKKDGELRPILDLCRLNAHLKTLTFKMLQTRHILESIEPGEWVTRINLKDAYFHVPICEEHQPLFRLSGTSISISGPSVRPLPVPEGVHQGSGGCLGNPSEEGFKDYALPRRRLYVPHPARGC